MDTVASWWVHCLMQWYVLQTNISLRSAAYSWCILIGIDWLVLTDWYWLIGIGRLIDTDSDCLQIGWHGSIGEQQVKCAGHSAGGSWKQLIKSVNIHLVSFIIKICLMINIIKGHPGTEQGLQVVLSSKIACRLSSESFSTPGSEHWLCYALTSVWSEHVVCLWNESALKGSSNVYKKREREAHCYAERYRGSTHTGLYRIPSG